MNYLSLINQFWAKDLEHSFTPNDIAVYFRLLERSNALGWKNPFNFSVDELLLKLRLKTKDPFTTARNRLKQAGLIDFRNGDGRGRTTTYYLLDAEEQQQEEETERGKKNTPLMPPLSPTLSPPLYPPGTPLLHKTKLNETKGKTANAVTASERDPSLDLEEGEDHPPGDSCRDRIGEEQTTSPEQDPSWDRTGEEQAASPEPVSSPPPRKPTTPGKRASKGRAARSVPITAPPPLHSRWPELVAELDDDGRATWERFVAWEQDNPLPKVFSMAEPLLPAQLVKLTRQHGSGEITGVLLDMQNRRTLLTDYESANLTVQSWLRNRRKRETAAS
ncbi:hypothetical protein [Hymenobacter metallilatus]|uniref:hypothetical protein n=1 Tax=Hymenobacter metallilatus TaxID=2493666 RepID=UPI00163AFBD5|nr:hypothetical protein [Hymenobacter metallilatus]